MSHADNDIVTGTAVALTNLLSPPVVLVATSVALALHAGGPRAGVAVAGYVAVAVLAPLALLFWMCERGKVRDVELTRRRDRAVPMLAAVVGLALGWQLVSSLEGPDALRAFAGAQFLLGVVMLGVTVIWKISVHTAQAAACAVVAWALGGSAWLPLTAVLVVLATRLVLNRHTPAQTAAGAVVGAAVMTFFVPLILGG